MSKERLIELAEQSGLPTALDYHQKRYEKFAELVRADERNSWPAEMEAMERQVNILTDALAKQPAQKRPQNCGTGYCSCIECVMEPAQQEPVGCQWTPCMKLPVVVHVRKQYLGEAHVSTREGITPVKPDDLIMRGVSGEEYPIGRAIFEQTYTLDTTPQAPKEKT